MIIFVLSGYKMNGEVSQADGGTGGGDASKQPLNLVLTMMMLYVVQCTFTIRMLTNMYKIYMHVLPFMSIASL